MGCNCFFIVVSGQRNFRPHNLAFIKQRKNHITEPAASRIVHLAIEPLDSSNEDIVHLWFRSSQFAANIFNARKIIPLNPYRPNLCLRWDCMQYRPVETYVHGIPNGFIMHARNCLTKIGGNDRRRACFKFIEKLIESISLDGGSELCQGLLQNKRYLSHERRVALIEREISLRIECMNGARHLQDKTAFFCLLKPSLFNKLRSLVQRQSRMAHARAQCRTRSGLQEPFGTLNQRSGKTQGQ